MHGFSRTLGTLGTLAASIGIAVATLATDPACARDDGKPVLVHHYDCDGTLLANYSTPATVPDGRTLEIETVPYGASYFTIYTEYENEFGVLNTKPMHFVLCSLDANNAKAIVSGRIESDDYEHALVELESGFLWVSSCAPENWEAEPPNYEAPGIINPGPPDRILNDPVVSWSLYTLIRSRFSWGGAVATEYVMWHETKGEGTDDDKIAMFNLEPTKAQHATRDESDGSYIDRSYLTRSQNARFIEGTGLQAASTNGIGDKGFLEYVKCRIASIESHTAGTDDCQARHNACIE